MSLFSHEVFVHSTSFRKQSHQKWSQEFSLHAGLFLTNNLFSCSIYVVKMFYSTFVLHVQENTHTKINSKELAS